MSFDDNLLLVILWVWGICAYFGFVYLVCKLFNFIDD